MKARLAANFIMALSEKQYPDDAEGMAQYVAEWFFNVMTPDGFVYDTHKYIPVYSLNADLKLPEGAGVFGYYKFTKDNSYILLTCRNGLALWDGIGKAVFWGDRL